MPALWPDLRPGLPQGQIAVKLCRDWGGGVRNRRERRENGARFSGFRPLLARDVLILDIVFYCLFTVGYEILVTMR